MWDICEAHAYTIVLAFLMGIFFLNWDHLCHHNYALPSYHTNSLLSLVVLSISFCVLCESPLFAQINT